MDPFLMVFAIAVMVFGGFVKGAIGFGFPLISTPLVAALLDPVTAVVSLSVPALLSNIIVLGRGGVRFTELKRVAPALVMIVFGTFLGAFLLTVVPARVLSIAVGTVAVLYVIVAATRYQPKISPRLERVTMPVVGAFGGAMMGATNISGPVFGLYLHALDFPKLLYVYSISLLFIVGNSSQLLAYWQQGLLSTDRAIFAAIACVPMTIGLLSGMWAQRRINQRIFSRLVLVVLFFSGGSLLVRSLFG